MLIPAPKASGSGRQHGPGGPPHFGPDIIDATTLALAAGSSRDLRYRRDSGKLPAGSQAGISPWHYLLAQGAGGFSATSAFS